MNVYAQRPPPRGWPRIASSVFYDDAGAALDFLVEGHPWHFMQRLREPPAK